MRVGIDQLFVSPLRPTSVTLPIPDAGIIEQARLHGLETLPAVRAQKCGAGRYEVLSGLLTWRVAQLLRVDTIDIGLIDIDDAAAQAMVCNDLNANQAVDPITLAESILDQIKVEGISRNSICRRYGLSKSQLSHLLRLLQLEPTVREWVRTGRLSAGKAKVLVKFDPREQKRIAQQAVSESLSTREVEGLVRNRRAAQTKYQLIATQQRKDSNTQQLEAELSESLGNPVAIEWNPINSTGEVTIRYFSLEELETVIDRLRG